MHSLESRALYSAMVTQENFSGRQMVYKYGLRFCYSGRDDLLYRLLSTNGDTVSRCLKK